MAYCVSIDKLFCSKGCFYVVPCHESNSNPRAVRLTNKPVTLGHHVACFTSVDTEETTDHSTTNLYPLN